MIEKKIISRPQVPDSHLAPSLHPIIRQLYVSRGVKADSELDNSLSSLHDFRLLKDVEKAAQILLTARKRQARILIVGDFDADGATSTAVLMHGLGLFGFSHLNYLVPNRFDLGYGLSPALADIVIAEQPELVITVDSGISCLAGIAKLKAAGIQVIVTDHHLQGEQLPNADAIVNPNQFDCAFPSKALAGCGVAFYLLIALRTAARADNDLAALANVNLAQLLDVVALGTVADVVPLDANNRTLVHQGLARIRQGQTRPGIRALVKVANRNMARLSASDFGFALAPRLNAAGRLDDMSMGVECLLAPTDKVAEGIASELDSLNLARREIEQGMQQEAASALSKLVFASGDVPDSICLYQADWHQGVIGILAGRIKEQYHRPTIIFAQGDEGELKGSGRSIEGVHLRDVLERINTQTPELIVKFGGHAMAAGMTIKAAHFERFKAEFDAHIQAVLTEEAKESVVLTDGALPSQCYSLDFATLLKQAGPWGQQFPEPVFSDEFELLQQRIVGERHLKLVVREKSGQVLDAIAFNVDLKRWPNYDASHAELAFSLDINEFRGKFNLQLMVHALRAC